MREIIEKLGNRMVTLIRVVNINRRDYELGNVRFYRLLTKYDHELEGMTMAIEAMGLDYNFEYDKYMSDVITAVIIEGMRFNV